jgi:molybdate transport system substrate-binding protein
MPGNVLHGRGVVRVLSPSAVHSSLEAIVEAYRGQGGEDLTLTFETAPALAARLAAGELADVVIAPPKVMDELVSTGKAHPDGRFQLGRVGVGVGVRTGAPLPDLSSTEALKRSLLAADAIIHTRASSGIYVAQLLERLGVAAAIKAKITTYHDAQGAFTRLANGTGREIGFGGITEVRRWNDRGLKLVGPLPPDIQNYTAYIAALSAAASNPEGARTFLAFLASPAAKSIFTAHGVD